MKILNVSTISSKVLTPIHNMQPAATVSNPLPTRTLSKDTVSFRGHDDDNICDNFGLLKEDYIDLENDASITNHFDTKAKENKNSELVLDTFSLKTNDKKIAFFGDDMDLASALEHKKVAAQNLETISNEKFSIISYDNEGVHYNLKYNKESHQLVAGSAEIIKNNYKDPIERVAIKPSRNNDGYIAHYQFIDDKNGERAVEDSYVLFDKNLQAKASHTSKSFQYSDGEKEVQKFARTYNMDGMPEEANVKDCIPYVW